MPGASRDTLPNRNQRGYEQPVVILGGFMGSSLFYHGLRDALASECAQPVAVVGTIGIEWLASIVPQGWLALLKKTDDAVRGSHQQSTTGQVTLVGHSAGGVLSRLYVASQSFMGHSFSYSQYVNQVITLGSPHYNRQTWLHGGLMSRWIEREYPGAYASPGVRYASIIGESITGDPGGTPRERQAYKWYKRIAGQGQVPGDGLVPLNSALLNGAQHIVLEKVSHAPGFGGLWYGSPEIVPRWWSRTILPPEITGPCLPSPTVCQRRHLGLQ